MATLSEHGEDTAPPKDQDIAVDSEVELEMSKSGQLLDLVKRSLKSCSLLLIVWLIGQLGFSFAWILLGLLVVILRDHLNYDKQLRLRFKRQLAVDEKKLIESIKHLPSWVHFPDKERAEWINRV